MNVVVVITLKMSGKIRSNKACKRHMDFPVSIVICRDCGFCFNSPAPTQKDLQSTILMV